MKAHGITPIKRLYLGQAGSAFIWCIFCVFLILLVLSQIAALPGQETPPAPTPRTIPPSPFPPPLDNIYIWFAQTYSSYGIWMVITGVIIAGLIGIVVAYSRGWLKSLEKQGEKHGEDFIKAGELPDATRRYLKFFSEDEKYVRFRMELGGNLIGQLEVNQIFVSICMVPESDSIGTTTKHTTSRLDNEATLFAAKEKMEPIDLAQAIKISPKLAIVGAAGSGKSTLLQWAGLACVRLNNATEIVSQEQKDFVTAIENRALIPVIIRLKAYHGYCKEKKIDYSATALLNFLTERLNEKHPTLDLPENFFEVHLAKTGCLVMLDGIDEVDPDDREAIRQAIEDLVKDFSKNIRNRYLVTSRSAAYFGASEVSGFRKCLVQNLSSEQRNLLITNWYQALIPDQYGKLAVQLGQLIDDSDARIQSLAITPLMVTIFAQFHYVEGKLPRTRAEMYEYAVKTILSGQHRGAGARSGWDDERNLLEYIAFQMHKHDFDDATEGDLIDLIWPGFGTSADQKHAREAARQFLHHTKDQGGLLEEQYRRYGFYTHRTFREYLAGRYLAEELSQDEQRIFLQEHLEKDIWEEPIHLAVGFLAYTGGRRPNDFIRLLASLGEDEEQHAIALSISAEALNDIPSSDEPRRVETKRVVVSGLKEILEENPPQVSERVRWRLGLALGNLGDPRFKITSLKPAKTWMGVEMISAILPELLAVPNGPFPMGTSPDDEKLLEKNAARAWDDEKPQQVVSLTAYEIGKYAVTNAEFRLFWEDRGYERSELWSAAGLRWRNGSFEPNLTVYPESVRQSVHDWLERRPVERRGQPFFWDDSSWNAHTLPVVGVCWFEAEAYCN